MRYAIFGGSFDPIHRGHIHLADSAVKECGIDILIFMPAYVSPFKQGKKISAAEDRCGMIERILDYNSAFRLSEYEIGNESPSYTIDTLRHFDEMLEGELCFVLGFDSVVQVDTWYHGDEILRNYPLITGRRPDTDNEDAMAKIDFLRKEYGADITVLDMMPVDISSTEIRNRIKEGQSISDLAAPEVEEYIIEHQLYK